MDFPYLLWRQAVGLPVAPIDAHQKAAWIREITDFVAIAKSRNRMVEVKRLLSALHTGKLTSATFSFLDPVPFFAEFALWVSSGLSRQKKAKDFLQFDPVASNLDQVGHRTEMATGEVRSADAPAWPLSDVRGANSPIVARFGLAALEGRQSQHRDSETSDAGNAATDPRK
jgi:hypothetical protein